MPVRRRGDSGRIVRELQERLGTLEALVRDRCSMIRPLAKAAICLLEHGEGLPWRRRNQHHGAAPWKASATLLCAHRN